MTTFSEFDRYTLALSVLREEADAHKILADLLEEQGERGLAQWSRSRKNRRHKRLGFVLSLLPEKPALLLACEFYEHSLYAYREFIRAPVRVLEALPQIRNWVVGELSGVELMRLVQTPTGSGSPPVNRIFAMSEEALRDAAIHSIRAEACAAGGDLRQFRGHKELALAAVRRVARSCQWDSPASLFELPWQIERTENVLEQVRSKTLTKGNVHG